MKANLSRMLRSGLALLLVFCMVAGFVPTMAFATEADEKTINYVSLGDSMSNGYGLTGYNHNGHNSYGQNAYTNQFKDWLKTEGYATVVNHSQMAISAMRAEDLHWILEYGNSGAYGGDSYTQNNFIDDRFNGKNGFNSVAVAAEKFQSAVSAADIISVGTGNANFGVFLMYSVTDAVGALGAAEDGYAWVNFEDALKQCDAETKAFVLQAYNAMKAKLMEKVPAAAAPMAEKVADRIGYVLVSYVINYGGALDAIVNLNPDAEIMIVGLINSMNGVAFDCSMNGKDFVLPVGDAMASMISVLNAYLAGLPATLQATGKYPEATFYFASSPNVEVIANVLNIEMMQNPSSVVRERTIKEVAGETNNSGEWEDGLVWSLLNNMDTSQSPNFVKITVDDVSAYESAIANNYSGLSTYLTGNTTQPKKMSSVAAYLAFEKAAIEASKMEGNLNGASVLKLMDMDALAASFTTVLEKYNENLNNEDFGNNQTYKKVATQGSNYLEDVFKILATPDALSNALLADEDMASLMNLFARMMVGDGIGSHPSQNGHNTLAAAVEEAYATNHTVQDETIENVEILLTELYKLVETYGPEVAEQVWAQWEEYGYVDAVETSIDELKTMLEERYTYYTETALPAIDASVKNLSAQKDALTAELTALKAELAAKQAELEAVVNGVEIGDIYVPDINIDVELGNNTQTIVPGNDCNVDGEDIKTELEAAVKDIEHAIAVIEALIADVEADIADMIALAEQIAAAVAELEKTMASVAEAAEDVEAAVNAVIDVIKNSDGVVDATVKSFEAARATAEAAVEVLSLTMATAEELMADVDTMIGKIAADAEALYNKFMNDLPGCIEAIPDEAKLLIAGSVYAVQQAYEANKEEIKAALTAELTKLAEEYNINEATIKAELDKLTKEYEASKAAVEAELTAIEAKIAAEVEAKFAEIEAEYNAQIEAAKAEAAAKLAALEEELKGYQAELEALAEDAAEEVKAGIQAQIDRVNADIATVKADLEHAVSHLENAAEEAYNQIVEEVTKVYEETVAALEQKLAELKAAFDEAVTALKQKLEELKAAYDKAVEDLTAAADKAIAELTDALNKALEELGKIGEALAEEINGILSAIRQELADAQKAVEEILKGNLAAIEELKNALIEMGGEAIVDAVNSLIDAVMALIEEATTADLVIDDDFKYVAIGDGSAASESYVDKLTAALNAEAAENGVDEIETVNYAKVGNTVAAERANLSDVSGADLITVGFSNVEFMSKAIANMSAGADLDWAAAVGEENVQYVDQLLAEVAAKITEAGIEGDYAIMANNAIEAYAYAAVLYATELPELVNEIHAVNPDAVIIIVGMYNPMDGVIINLGENATLDIGEYVDYLVKGVGVHGVAYSILTGNSIYVDAPAVQTVNTDTELGILDLLTLMQTGCASLYPSAVGDDYIAAEIADALNITYVKSEVEVLLGDVNGDGVVDAKDVTRLRKYMADPDTTEINFKNADVNLDGVVDAKDMTRMRKHFADGVAFG